MIDKPDELPQKISHFSEQPLQQKKVEIVKKVEDAIDSVRKKGALSVYEDTYDDQMNPNYIIFNDEEELGRFEELLRQTREAMPDDFSERRRIFDELDKIVGKSVEAGNLYWIYKGGEWAIPPDALIDDAISWRLQEEDWDWFEAQREHFAEMENPTPIVTDEPWRKKVQDLAIEIAAKEGRAPEEVDFNTARLRLRGEIPKEETDQLLRDLKAVEEGRSSSDR